MRTRLVSDGPSAQSCPRRILKHLLGHTVDLDIENCCFVILHQLVQKMNTDIPEESLQLLALLATERGQFCRDQLHTDVATGKHLLNCLINGGGVPAQWEGNPSIAAVQRLAFYLRWLACTELPEVYAKCCEDGRRHPEVSTLFFMWSMVEDYILQKWLEFVLRYQASHVSLHFDGIRVNTPLPYDTDEYCKKCADHIAQSTEFAVTIRPKEHRYFLELFVKNCTTTAKATVEHEFLELPGNCIPLALHQLLHNDRGALAKLGQPVVALANRSRTYRSVASLWNVKLVPRTGMQIKGSGRFLVHSEADGNPHFTAVSVANGVAFVYHEHQRFETTPGKLEEWVHEALDQSSIVTFQVFTSAEHPVCPVDIDQTNLDALLDLQAGARKSQSCDDLVCNVECTGSDDEMDVVVASITDIDDVAIITVGDSLLAYLKDRSDSQSARRRTIATLRTEFMPCNV